MPYVRWTEALRVVRACHPEVTIIMPEEKIQIYPGDDVRAIITPMSAPSAVRWTKARREGGMAIPPNAASAKCAPSLPATSAFTKAASATPSWTTCWTT